MFLRFVTAALFFTTAFSPLTPGAAKAADYPFITFEYGELFDRFYVEATRKTVEPAAVEELGARLESFRGHRRREAPQLLRTAVKQSASSAAAQDARAPDGAIVENAPCAAPARRTYEQYLAQQKASLEQEVKDAERESYKVDYLSNLGRFVLSREEFGRRESFTDYDCRRVKYMSDGLKVVGYVWRPKNVAGKKLPLVIVNRGGNPNLATLTPQSFFYPYVTNGFIVIGSQYRGADGGEGQDEFGGADVNDVLNLIPLARSLGYVDMNNVFMHGVSRGGMQTFLALKKGMPVNAVAVVGALSDLTAAAKERPGVAQRVWGRLIPGYAEKNEEALRERSAVHFAERITVPVMILHGGADWRSNAGSQSLSLASRLQSLGKTYELHVYAGDDHPLSINRLDREQRIVEWFKKHMN